MTEVMRSALCVRSVVAEKTVSAMVKLAFVAKDTM